MEELFMGPDNTDLICSIISVIGTLLGTILGWILHFISNNIGKNYIFIDYFKEQISENEEYAYITKVFFNNVCYKQQSIRNLRIVFEDCNKKNIFESFPANEKCNFNTIRKVCEEKEEVAMISIYSFSQIECHFSDLIDCNNYKKIMNAKKIYLKYEDNRNRTKKKLIKNNFSISTIEKCEGTRFM